jgi:predicted  nucleic acid-binding Zn-ribbon protein
MMETTAGPARILRELHRLRRHAKNLQTEIERLPRQLKVAQGKVTRQEETIKQAQDGLKKLKVSVKGKEDALKAAHEQATKYKRQRDTVADKKEYDALSAELTTTQTRCQQLEDEILTGLAETDERAAQIPELEKALKQAQHEVANFDQISKGRQTELQGELDKTLADIKRVDAMVPTDFKPLYDRQVNARGEDALAQVVERTCQACYTGITAQQFNELSQEQFVLCKNCGRILYLPE